MRLFIFLLMAFLCSASLEKASGQVAIYRFNFEKDGPAINYGFYDEAWVVADAVGGPASWIFTFKEGPFNRYVQVAEFGSLFYANNQKETYGVISAAASTGTPQTTFLAMGPVEDTVKSLDGNIRVKVADEMEGSTISADDQSILPFNAEEGNIGYAAISTMTGGLEAGRTEDANEEGFSVEETIADIITYLERRGFSEFTVVDDGETDDEVAEESP